jgi:hypothetical protein
MVGSKPKVSFDQMATNAPEILDGSGKCTPDIQSEVPSILLTACRGFCDQVRSADASAIKHTTMQYPFTMM